MEHRRQPKKDVDFVRIAESVARKLLGEINAEKSTAVELRWGTQGSLSLKLATGEWFDHENGKGGGVLALVEYKMDCDRAGAMKWLQEQGFIKQSDELEPTRKLIAQYRYTDESGTLLFEVLRYTPKAFVQRNPSGDFNIRGIRRVLYRLPELIAAVTTKKVVYLIEGEKDTDNLVDIGLAATTAPGGANKWRDEYNAHFSGADVVLLPDHDEAGRSHMVAVANSLSGIAKSVRIVDLAQHWPAAGTAPEKADVTDWLAVGGTREELEKIITAAPLWVPSGDAAATDGVSGMTKPEQDAFLADLARLDRIEYDRRRIASAKTLGIRPVVLDLEVKALRELVAVDSSMAFMAPVESWPKPVNGENLLNETFNVLHDHVIFSDHAAVATVLWIVHAHAVDAATHSPILAIESPSPRCGKTTLLGLIGRLVPKPLASANVTPAVVFRAIDRFHPTMLIDEADTMNAQNHDLRGILNSGHERRMAYALRSVGDNHEPKSFSTWAPKAIALIGKLHPTLQDRSIIVEMSRRLPTDIIERIPKSPSAFADLLRRIARWAEDNLDALRDAEPVAPKKLHDRARDNWDALLAIADVVGGDWPDLARNAALKLSMVDESEVSGIELLRDLRALFGEEEEELASEWVVEQLSKMEDRPWPEFRHDKPITTTAMARLLKPFKIKPGKTSKGQGYKWKLCAPVFDRYLGASPSRTL